MRLYLQRVLAFMLIVICCFLVLFVTEDDRFMTKVCFCLISMTLVLCSVNNALKIKDSFFYFLLLYFSAELLTVMFPRSDNELLYVAINSVYILSFLVLIFFTINTINLSDLWQKFGKSLIVLLLFSGVLLYNMNDIMFGSENIALFSACYFVDSIYNIVIILLLCSAFLSFIYNDSKKTLLLFLVCLSFVFSDVIQLADIYISNYKILFILFSTFKLVGFCLCYFYIDVRQNVYYRLLS